MGSVMCIRDSIKAGYFRMYVMDDMKFEFRPDMMEVAPGNWIAKNYPIDWFNIIRESLDNLTNDFYTPETFDLRNIMVMIEHNENFSELDKITCPDYCGYFSPSVKMRSESSELLPQGDLSTLHPERLHRRMIAVDLGSETIDSIHSDEYIQRVKRAEFEGFSIAAVDIELSLIHI